MSGKIGPDAPEQGEFGRVPSESWLRRFVLGIVHDEDFPAAEEFESKIFVDDGLAELVMAVEEDLLDSLSDGSLDPEEERRFRARLRGIDPGGKRLAFAQTWRDAVRAQELEQNGSGRLRGSVWGRLLPLAAGLALAFWGSYQLVGDHAGSDVQQLDSRQWRSGGELPVLDETTPTLPIAVGLDLSANDYALYRVELVDPDGVILEEWDSLTVVETDLSVLLNLDIRPESLSGGSEFGVGDYALDVYGMGDSGPELLESFPFRFRRSR